MADNSIDAKLELANDNVHKVYEAGAEVPAATYVKYTDYATSEKAGLVKVPDDSGIELESDGSICVKAATEAEIDAGTETCRPIVPSNLDYAVKACTTAEVSEDQTSPVQSQAVKSALDQLKAEMKEQSVPHTTVSDYPVVLTDALAGERLRECRIYGSAAGVGDADGDAYKIPVRVCGKNLISYPYANTTVTKNGLTFTDNGDGIITVNGTATADTMFFYANISKYKIRAGTYTLSGCPKGGSSTTYCQVLGSSDFIDIGNSIARTYAQDIPQNIFLKIFSGVTVENLVFKPQLEFGTTATEYEEYKGSTATATLSTQLADGEYIDVINKKRYASDGTQTDITVEGELKTIESGSITIDCTTQVQPPKIDVEYWQDINKVIEELTNAILAQGGNT